MVIFTLMKNLLTLAFVSVLSITSFAQEDSLRGKLFEISFGRSILFISNSKVLDVRAENAVVVPTTAILFLAEFRPQKKLRIPLFYNLATETKQFLVKNELVNEKTNPTFGFGIQYRLLQFNIEKKSKMEFEAGPLASFLVSRDKKLVVAPVLACRLRLWRGESISMYVGTSYSFGINCWGLLYGTGTIF